VSLDQHEELIILLYLQLLDTIMERVNMLILMFHYFIPRVYNVNKRMWHGYWQLSVCPILCRDERKTGIPMGPMGFPLEREWESELDGNERGMGMTRREWEGME
jgi:hypothetical protein